MNAGRLRRLRPFVQAAAFVLFVVLALTAGAGWLLPADLIFWADPLAAATALLAARRIVPGLLIGGAAALLLALVLGRAWCGWLCPLGTLLDWMPSRRTHRDRPDPLPGWRRAKYLLLAFILAAAVLGNLTLLILDPLTLLVRTIAGAAWPALIAVVTGIETALYGIPFLQAPIDAFEGAVRGTLLPLEQPLYRLNLAPALVLAGVLALNAVQPRFWCRYLCPLGGLLGLAGKLTWLRRRVGTGCVSCGRCAQACPMGTIDPDRGYASDPAECTLCLDCVPACARLGQHFAGHLRPAAWREYDPARRQFVAAAAAAVAVTGLAAAQPAARRDHPRLIRPPGAQDSAFLSACIRCGLCLRACPTSGLQPGLAESGWAGLWTPVLVPRLGHCDYGCNACGEACPTGAIPALDLAAKQTTVIGHAAIDRDRCIPWAEGRICLVCEEMCPLPDKAIVLEELTVTTVLGETVELRRPHVVRERCIGCGICENRCPLNGEAAIRVYAPTDLA